MNTSPDQPADSNPFARIEQICRDYRSQLKQGGKQRIEDCMRGFESTSQSMLFRNLLHIDIEYRRRQHDQPSSDEYSNRFPQYRKIIREAFFESTMMSMDEERETPADVKTAIFEMPAARRLGDYELLDELGRGGFGVVYEARHLEREERVALKTLPTGLDGQTSTASEAERLHKFRREFRSLAEINHPNLVGMQTLEVEQGQWFFTMDLVRGDDFLSYIRPDDTLDEKRLRATLPQLAAGIMALHDQHVVHRDLKPSNILVGEDGHVTILDFGLVAELDHRTDHTMSLRSQHFAGTPRYAAPEQVYGKRDSASDWYAFGTMVFEAITGSPPFEGASAELIVRKQNEAAPRLSERDDLPDDLARLVDQLLLKEPNSRPDATAIAQILSISRPAPRSESLDSKATGTWVPSESLLIGIESNLEELETALSRVEETGQTHLVFVSGKSGEGKSSLVDKFLEPMKHRRRTIILAGRCYDRESVPFKALDSIIDSLGNHLRARTDDELTAVIPDDIVFLAHLFPILRRVDAIAKLNDKHVAACDAEQIRHRGFRAMRELLCRLTESTSIVMFIDDLQWGDAESAAMLFRLLAPPDSPRLLFLGSYRSDERDQSPFLSEWDQVGAGSELVENTIHTNVRPLTRAQCIDLLERRIGYSNETIRGHAIRLFEETGGNAYFLDQLIDCFDPSSEAFESTPVSKVIEKKLGRLPDNARALLQVIAVAGQSVSLREASEASGQLKPLFATVTHMRSERLVRLIGLEDQQLVDTYHDRIRETVLNSLDTGTRRSIHSRIAEVIELKEGLGGIDLLQATQRQETQSAQNVETNITSRLFDLAYHYFESSSPRAFAYQLLAGEQALAAHAPVDALAHLEKAEQVLPDYAAKESRFRLWESLGRVCSFLNQSSRAIAYFERSLEEAESKFDVARAHLGKGLVLQKQSFFRKATESYDLALESINARRPKGRIGCVIKSLSCSLRIVLIPANWQRARKPLETARAKLAHEVYKRLILITNEVTTIHLVHAALTQSVYGITCNDRELEQFGYGQAGTTIGGFGLRRISYAMLRRAERIESSTPEDVYGSIRGFFSGWLDYRFGRLSDAAEGFESSFAQTKRIGEHIYAVLNIHMLRHTYAINSATSRELKAGRQELALAESARDLRGMCWARFGMANAHARRGDIAAALRHIDESLECVEHEPINFAEGIARTNNAFVLMQASDYVRANEQAIHAHKLLKQTMGYQEFLVRVLPFLVESALGPNWNSESQNLDRRKVRKSIRTCLFWAGQFPTLVSPMHRAVGRAMASFGKPNKAIKRFEKAISCAEVIGAEYDRARALLDLSVLDENRRDELRNEAIALLKKTESVIPYAERWQLGDDPDEACFAKQIDS